MLTSVAKFLSLLLECVSAEPQPWHTFDDCTAAVQVGAVAGGVEITLDVHLHFLGTAVLGACLESAVSESF